jgi:probable DNA repair protein
MLRDGLQVWGSPDVLSWEAWLERQLDAAREQGLPIPRRLTPTEDWLMWQEAVHEACRGLDVLMPDGLIDPVRRAAELLDDYGLRLAGANNAEVSMFQRALRHYRQRCEELNVMARVSWRDLLPYLRPTAPLMLAGFAGIGPQRWRWLSDHGARLAPQLSGSGSAETIACSTPEEEAERAARWCASQLGREQVRLLVVVPRLAEQRHVWERAFSQQLNAALIFEGRDSSADSGFALEGGRPLASYRLVASALGVLALGAGAARFEQLSELLRSAYLGAFDRDACLQLDRALRDRGVRVATLSALRSLLPWVSAEVGERAATMLTQLLQALTSPDSSDATPVRWAQRWADQLEQCGWPGERTLSGDEQQVRQRFDELLGDFAAVTVPIRRLSAVEAYERLRLMAERVAFEPATDDVPVTLSARLEDPIVGYDGVWIAGLSADVWPPPARPDPLLPLPLQLGAGIDEASAEGQGARALQLQQRWQQTSPLCIFSWSHADEGTPGDGSPLLPPGSAPTDSSGAMLSLERWLSAQAPSLQIWADRTQPLQPPEGVLKGGTHLLELQSQCPFRAFAELRLHALPLESPQPGVSPRLRGMILHRALELFWRQMETQAALAAAAPSLRQQRARDSVTQAIGEALAREPGRFSESLMQREQARTVMLMEHLMKWELDRPVFRIDRVEVAQRHGFTGAALDLRLDRVDELEDGRLLVIDYKSGAAAPFDALALRPPQPQLPAYALAAGEDTAAVVTLYLGREGVKSRGLADRSGRIARLPAPKPDEPCWNERLQRWRQQLQSLVDEFLRGDAAIRPQPDACKFCHLHLLCRIDAAALAALDTDPDAVQGEDPEEEEVDE